MPGGRHCRFVAAAGPVVAADAVAIAPPRQVRCAGVVALDAAGRDRMRCSHPVPFRSVLGRGRMAASLCAALAVVCGHAGSETRATSHAARSRPGAQAAHSRQAATRSRCAEIVLDAACSRDSGPRRQGTERRRRTDRRLSRAAVRQAGAVAALPIAAVEPTPFQRDLSPTHTKRLAQKIEESGSFLDPLIVVRGTDGRLWTPNGRHRLAAAKVLGLKQITALISPDEALAFTSSRSTPRRRTTSRIAAWR